MTRKFDLTKAAEPQPATTEVPSFRTKQIVAWTREDEAGRLVGLYTPEQAEKCWGGTRWPHIVKRAIRLTPIFKE